MCDCVKSTRKTNVIYHDRKDFNCIFIRDKMDLFLTQGPEFEVRVEAGENLQRLIKTELDGETLKVFNNNRCNWVRGYNRKIRVYVTAPNFKYIQNAGLGTIESLNTIVQDEIKLRVENSGDLKLSVSMHKIVASAHGNGDLYLSGTTDILEDDYTGTNYLYANELTINDYVYLHSVSIGHAHINAPENGVMDIIIDRAGDVYYSGNPGAIHLTNNGKGDLIRE
ncbi:MAG: head GIN domain-containing protein [Bacteroidota bacterium]